MPCLGEAGLEPVTGSPAAWARPARLIAAPPPAFSGGRPPCHARSAPERFSRWYRGLAEAPGGRAGPQDWPAAVAACGPAITNPDEYQPAIRKNPAYSHGWNTALYQFGGGRGPEGRAGPARPLDDRPDRRYLHQRPAGNGEYCGGAHRRAPVPSPQPLRQRSEARSPAGTQAAPPGMGTARPPQATPRGLTPERYGQPLPARRDIRLIDDGRAVRCHAAEMCRAGDLTRHGWLRGLFVHVHAVQ